MIFDLDFNNLLHIFWQDDGPLELSNAGRPKRKGRQDISYKLFYSENVDEEELQDFFSKRDGRFVIFVSVCISADHELAALVTVHLM